MREPSYLFRTCSSAAEAVMVVPIACSRMDPSLEERVNGDDV
jgi:hypothetical protein